MTVSELIEQLQTIPGDTPVLLQKDAEGNGFRPCAGAVAGVGQPEDEGSHIWEVAPSAEDAEEYGVYDPTPVCVIWPV